MKNKQWILPFLMCFIPLIIGAAFYSKMPEMMPIHFNFEGVADNYASKEMTLFGLPLLMAALELVCVFAMKTDPKRKNYSEKLLTLSFWIIPVLSTLIQTTVIFLCLGVDLQINFIIPIFLGVLFIIIGNYLPKVKQNYTMGIKIPWTLNSEENWRKTHRFGGFAFVLAGFWLIFSALTGIQNSITIIPLFIATLAPMVYSWMLYRKESNDKENQ